MLMDRRRFADVSTGRQRQPKLAAGALAGGVTAPGRYEEVMGRPYCRLSQRDIILAKKHETG